ncbi:MAG: hypothetical protein A3F16_06060 [Deltaproteobacteria bacterium RIFCSPHIGHO2_12_FULL_43_9]|nr:MAG: hypothetical protein A3F16_06060 [Deltaproteobacteria bacterium RIFCSPHIGHO2_12_FULL_43_9]
MRAGAVDYILKPSGELSLDLDKVREQIISRIKEVSHATVRRLHPSRVKERKKVRLTGAEPRKVIVIGASTGGPPLIEEILSELPAHYSNVILVAQHMPKFFTQSFAARLNGLTDIFVKEAESGEPIKSGEVLIIPGGIHIKVEQRKVGGGGDVFKLTKDDKEDGIFPSIDLLMSSVAQAYGDRVVGVLLSGMGTDGLEGMRAIKRCGGHTIAQDPKTAVVSSMPGAVIENNLADEILTPKQIAQKIIKLG